VEPSRVFPTQHGSERHTLSQGKAQFTWLFHHIFRQCKAVMVWKRECIQIARTGFRNRFLGRARVYRLRKDSGIVWITVEERPFRAAYAAKNTRASAPVVVLPRRLHSSATFLAVPPRAVNNAGFSP
jgi:hypothetical protein